MDAVEPDAVLEGEGGTFLKGDAAQLGHLIDGIAQITRMVALAAEGDGGEIGAVGLDHNAVGRDIGDDLQCLAGIVEGDNTGEGDMEAHIQQLTGGFLRAAEAVDNAIVNTRCTEDIQDILAGLAFVDDDGDLMGLGNFQLLGKGLALDIALGEIVVIIEADLTQCPDLIVGQHLFDLQQCFIAHAFGFVGMKTDGTKDMGEALAQFDGIAGSFQITADVGDVFYALTGKGSQQFIANLVS